MGSEREHGGGPFIQTAAMFGLALARRSDEAEVLIYDSEVEEFPFSKVDSILTQALKITPRGGTNTELPFRALLNYRYKADTIVLLTDEQQNAGDPVVDIIKNYQATVNPKVKVFIVDVAPYSEKLTPPDMPGVFYLYGWSDQVLNFIDLASKGFGSLVEAIEKEASYGRD
jgi:60 kDa SS-A/Ro ribonucleoprotein